MSLTIQCPNCHSMDVFHDGIHVEDMDEIELFFTCRKCGHAWKDVFELGSRIRTSVLQQGNKSRKYRTKRKAATQIKCSKCGSPYMTHQTAIALGMSGDNYGYYEYKEWYKCNHCGHIEPAKPDAQPIKETQHPKQ